jgi:hypothetical protein
VPKLEAWMIAAAALLCLTGCDGESPGDRPQEYMIDQDINASHGAGMPTSVNSEQRAFEMWRHDAP